MSGNRKCVFDCESPRSLFKPPKEESTRQKWFDIIYGSTRHTIQHPLVCDRHFTEDCFVNLGQFQSGLSSKLRLQTGAIPTIKASDGEATATSAAIHLPPSRIAACQTDPVPTRTGGTQLSSRTLQPPYRSRGVQATVSCNEISDQKSTADPLSSSLFKRPRKRPRLELGDELEDDSFEGPSLLTATCEPADCVTKLTHSSVFSQKSSTRLPHKMKKYIVYESCFLELFASCPVCTRKCDVRTRTRGTFLSVNQRCPHCEFSRHWRSQPILGSTPAGSIHLSAAVYLSGASFLKKTKHFVNGQVQVLNQTKEKLRGRRSIKRCISSVQDGFSTDEAAETEQHVINNGGGAALFEDEAPAKLAMDLKSSKVEKKLCHASCQTDPVKVFPNDARVILLGKDFPPLFVKVADPQGTSHYRNYHSSDQSSQPTPTLIQDTCTTNAFSQGIKSKPLTFGQDIRSEPPIFGQEIKSEPPTFSIEIKSEPQTFGQEVKSEPPTSGKETRSEPPTFSIEIKSEPQTFGQEVESEPPTSGKETRSEPPTFGQEIKSEPPTFNIEIKSEPPTFSQEIESEPPSFGQEIKSEPPTFAEEIRAKLPMFSLEIKSKTLTHTSASPILQSSTASPLMETAAHNHQFG